MTTTYSDSFTASDFTTLDGRSLDTANATWVNNINSLQIMNNAAAVQDGGDANAATITITENGRTHTTIILHATAGQPNGFGILFHGQSLCLVTKVDDQTRIRLTTGYGLEPQYDQLLDHIIEDTVTLELETELSTGRIRVWVDTVLLTDVNLSSLVVSTTSGFGILIDGSTAIRIDSYELVARNFSEITVSLTTVAGSDNNITEPASLTIFYDEFVSGADGGDRGILKFLGSSAVNNNWSFINGSTDYGGIPLNGSNGAHLSFSKNVLVSGDPGTHYMLIRCIGNWPLGSAKTGLDFSERYPSVPVGCVDLLIPPLSVAARDDPTTYDTAEFSVDIPADINSVAIVFEGHTNADLHFNKGTAPTGHVTITQDAPLTNSGANIFDVATISGGTSPTGNIIFKLYGPISSTVTDCSGDPIFTSTKVLVTGILEYTSDSYLPAVSGEYRWVAEYEGDDNNAGVITGCYDASEKNLVLAINPGIIRVSNSGAQIYFVRTGA